MARIASEAKMGFYPTPEISLDYISRWISSTPERGNRSVHFLDPCCGEGEALACVSCSGRAWTWGIELDSERAMAASSRLHDVIAGSIFEARINPLGSMGLLWLNPPYSIEDGERLEMKFLRHGIKWLASGGLLVFIVPEHVLSEANLMWICEHFDNVFVTRMNREDYPRFKQVVLFGKKRIARTEVGGVFAGPYPYIEDIDPGCYLVPPTEGPEVFQCGHAVTDEEIRKNRPRLLEAIRRITGDKEEARFISPLLPLRKGHLVALMTAGILDGKIETGDGHFIIVKGFSERTRDTRIEGDKEITRDTYAVGIRVMEEGGKWYDIR